MSFDPYELYSQYNPMGRNMGNPMLNMLMMSLFGRNNYMPSLAEGENVYDSFLLRERSNQFMKLQGSSFANNMLFKRMGIGQNPMMHMLGSFAASPDSMVGKALFPMLGGNPMAASMQTYAKLSGANVMGNFGRLHAITADETEHVMQGLAENFYSTKAYEGDNGGREDIREEARKFLQERLNKQDFKYLEDVGFNVETDDSGAFVARGLQEQIDKFDPTAGKGQEQLVKESRQRVAGNLSSQIAKIMNTSDEDTSKALLERLEKQVTAFNVMTKDQFRQTLNTAGLEGIRRLVREFEKSGGVQDNAEAIEARKNISGEFAGYLDTLTSAPVKNKQQLSKDIEAELVAGGYATPAMLDKIRGQDGLIDPVEASKLVKQYDADDKHESILEDVQKQRSATQQQLTEKITALQEAPERQTKQEILEQIRKKAIDSGVVTEKEWGNMLNESGELDTQKFNEYRTEFERRGAFVETDESKEAGILSSRRLLKQNTATEILSDAAKITQEKDTNKKKELSERLITKLKDSGEFSDDAISKMLDEKTGLITEGKIKPAMTSYSAMDKLEYLNLKSKKMQEAGLSYTGFNFENSRGFKLEDFTSAFGKGAELRMFGDNRTMSPEDVMRGFSQHGVGALSAARAVFGGGKSAAEYMEKMSSLVGGLDVNLANREGNEKMENLLRDVEATSRVAGISIKTMLSIIESAQQLAADNPQLSTMSKSAITKLSLNAVQRATDTARAMSAEDYRMAGGSDKMAAQEAQESLTFAQSPLGGSLASLLLRAKKDPKVFEWFSQKVKEGKATGRGLDDGLFAELAEKLGVSTSDLAYSAANPLMAKQALKQADIAELVTGEGGKETIFNSFLGGDLYNARKQKGEKFEDFKNRIIEEHKAYIDKGGTEEGYANEYIIPNLTVEGGEVYQQYQQTIRAGLIDSMRTPEQRDEMRKLITRQREASKELDKQYSAQRSPLVTQLMDAIMKKNEVSADVVIDATTAAFATKEGMSEQRKKLTEEAKTSLENMGKNSGKTDIELIGTEEAPGQGLEALNKMIGLRRQQAQEAGDKGNEKEAGLAKNLKELSAEELSFTADKTKHLTGTLNENKELLVNLEKKESKREQLSTRESDTLRALRNLRKIGAMENESVFTTAQKGGVGGLVSAVTESVFSANDNERMEQMKKNRLEQAEQDLNTRNAEEMQTGGGLTSGMLEYYKDKGGVAQAAEDYKNRKGMFENEQTREVYAKSKPGQILAFTNEQIATDEQQAKSQAAAEGGKTPTDKMQENIGKSIKSIDELKAAVEELKDSITSGGAVGDALGRLASALTTGTATVTQAVVGGSAGYWNQ